MGSGLTTGDVADAAPGADFAGLRRFGAGGGPQEAGGAAGESHEGVRGGGVSEPTGGSLNWTRFSEDSFFPRELVVSTFFVFLFFVVVLFSCEAGTVAFSLQVKRGVLYFENPPLPELWLVQLQTTRNTVWSHRPFRRVPIPFFLLVWVMIYVYKNHVW